VICCATAAAGSTASANAIPSPATASSRNPRQFNPLTCTCSSSPERWHLRPAALRVLTLRKPLLYLAGAHPGQPATVSISLLFDVSPGGTPFDCRARTGLINHPCQLARILGPALLSGSIAAHYAAEAFMRPVVCF
jgi:hypothetical protein